MENVMNETPWLNVAEVELVYKSKIKASDRPHISHSKATADLLRGLWDQDKIDFVEQFNVLLLNRANRVLGIVNISTGGVTATVADPKLILVSALKANACGIIIAHNHPSGNTEPSNADQQMTQKIKTAAEYMDIRLLDHIIVTSEGYYSFADEGLL